MAVVPRERRIAALGVDTYVAEAGEGPPVVLLHGNPDTHRVWEGVVERLAPRFRCLTPDLPGFGASRAPDDFDCSLGHQAAWVRAVLDALELPRPHLVVHDVGGTYGLAFASESPERIETLTILNCNFFPDYRWHFWARIWRTPVLGEIAMAVMNRPLFVREMRAGSPRITREQASEAYDAVTPATKRMVLRWYRAMDPEVHAGWDERLRQTTASRPTQVLWGDRDPFLPASIADRFGGAVHRLGAAGHWPMMEDPELVARRIAELAGTGPQRPAT